MPKETKGQQKGARSKYETTEQTETYRQQDAKEKKILGPKTKLDLEKLEPYFTQNNNYVGIQDNSTAVAYSHPLDRLGIVENEYCQKCKKDKGFCPHKKDTHNTVKDQFQFPIVSSAEIGWREPIDNVNWGYGVKQSFPIFNADFRNTTKKEEKEKK
ncbi:unnamed protein product (macronuclear) [Paramecium tetraurelia]|uniref:Pre-mRNA-splicing factor SLU7 n=1 Tax=Paramecium tetraurelia TaxID=5888 RepID=A0BL77_PARTE|nr:uncharacterized protein GSPATT00029926001 [Paramecium tetraurelia]CAK59294.1 unnamed protein product [Paramecium tetraurelia]|eukprot:XP_001426692.1 hypothetical protein (macronuclear) [Paramecium tetraurelia strain d4-2]